MQVRRKNWWYGRVKKRMLDWAASGCWKNKLLGSGRRGGHCVGAHIQNSHDSSENSGCGGRFYI